MIRLHTKTWKKLFKAIRKLVQTAEIVFISSITIAQIANEKIIPKNNKKNITMSHNVSGKLDAKNKIKLNIIKGINIIRKIKKYKPIIRLHLVLP
jgi:hypothetical protein